MVQATKAVRDLGPGQGDQLGCGDPQHRCAHSRAGTWKDGGGKRAIDSRHRSCTDVEVVEISGGAQDTPLLLWEVPELQHQSLWRTVRSEGEQRIAVDVP